MKLLFISGPHKVCGRFETTEMSPNATEWQINIGLRVHFYSMCEMFFFLRHVLN